MADVGVLMASLGAMLPTVWPLYRGEVTVSSPALPWAVWQATAPGSTHQAEGPAAHAGTVTLSVRVAAATDAGATQMLAAIYAAIDGATPAATGWSCGSLREHQPPRADPTDLVVAGVSTHLWIGVASWRTTVSPLP